MSTLSPPPRCASQRAAPPPGPRPPAAPDTVFFRRQARLRVFRGEDPHAVIQFLHAVQVPDAAALVERYRAERRRCLRSQARAMLLVCGFLLLALIGMWEWIRPMGVPPLLAFLLLFSAVGMQVGVKAASVCCRPIGAGVFPPFRRSPPPLCCQPHRPLCPRLTLGNPSP